MATRRVRFYLFSILGILLVGISLWMVFNSCYQFSHFIGQRAYQDLVAQVSFGARTPGSIAHSQAISYIQQELEKTGWNVRIQETNWLGFSISNIIATRSMDLPYILLGAHYDSRLLADQDKGPGRNGPVPGANDGASGVAILLELARSIPSKSVPVRMVFFDAEDNGGLENRQWIMGSRAFVTELSEKPKSVIIVDMVGDIELNLYIERSSDYALASSIWAQAVALGYENNFTSEKKYELIDDHTPFLEVDIPAVVIIDFDYPYWHTGADTLDKVSVTSLQTVGDVLWEWIDNQQ
jgi:glutaminyl-peptide cyclotransferase